MGLKELVSSLPLLLILLQGVAGADNRGVSTHVQTCGDKIMSNYTKNDTITSPNYPEPYPPNIYCIYQFMGGGKERVQIIFTDFDLHLPHEPPINCDSVDALMVFITINGQKERVDNFCGNKLPNQLMSNGPTMIIEFRSFHSSPAVKGFRAMYHFVTDFGIIGGKQEKDSVCNFTFRSEEWKNGTFTSPNYPGFYPRDTECHYVFYGTEKERVHITFSHFEVEGIGSCSEDTASDYVEFSNSQSTDRRIARHCGFNIPKTIKSDGNYFRVTFKSNDKFDAIGFKAQYQFKKTDDPSTVKRISTTVKTNSNGGVCIKCTALHFLMLTYLTVLFL